MTGLLISMPAGSEYVFLDFVKAFDSTLTVLMVPCLNDSHYQDTGQVVVLLIAWYTVSSGVSLYPGTITFYSVYQ